MDDYQISAWYTDLSQQPQRRKQLVSELRKSITLTEASEGKLSRYGLLIFDNTTSFSALKDFLLSALPLVDALIIAINLDERLENAMVGWQLLKIGIADLGCYQPKVTVSYVINKLERWRQIDAMATSAYVADSLVGGNRVWKKLLRQVVEVATFTQANLLIIGQSGTGKELLARLIHDLDTRRNKDQMVVLDCTTISPELSGSEFFGHERGAFTNAVATRDGAFALAHKGTLFLDEVGELPPKMQAELLRVIQEGTYKRVGSNNWRRANFRLVCATNRDLETEVAQGRFRPDLYYRIATWVVRVPALHERRDDIPALIDYFMGQVFRQKAIPPLDPLVYSYFMTRNYPGNIRELQHLVKRVAMRHVGDGPITIGDIPFIDRPESSAGEDRMVNQEFSGAIHKALACGMKLKDIKEVAAEVAITLAMEGENGINKNAADKLGITNRALQLRLAARKSKFIS